MSTLSTELPMTQQQIENERILARYFNVPSIKGDNRALVKQFLWAAVSAAFATPVLFYLKFGTINWFSISFTIFLVVLCLLFALGFQFYTKTEYHTDVPMKGNLADRIGAFWLVACAFGPFFGWIVTAIGLSASTWKWQYLARAFLAVILPVVTAVPLVPYARGKAALIAIPLLLLITSLPISSCLWVLQDLHDGPTLVDVEILAPDRDGQPNCRPFDPAYQIEVPCQEIQPTKKGEVFRIFWLPHTRRVLTREQLIVKSLNMSSA